MCGACRQHLGWHFRKRARGGLKEPSQGSFPVAGFFGLILDRLVLPAADS
jgi:hypothetical protein